MTYILVDTANMFFRARHVVRGDSIETKIGMAYHIMLASILKSYRDFNGSHVVFCLEGRSWRKDFYEPYKACLLYTSPSPRDLSTSRMPSSA